MNVYDINGFNRSIQEKFWEKGASIIKDCQCPKEKNSGSYIPKWIINKNCFTVIQITLYVVIIKGIVQMQNMLGEKK